MKIVKSDSELFHVVAAARAASRFAGLLHGWQQQGDQDCDDRNHDQQFDQRETTPGRARRPRWETSTHRQGPPRKPMVKKRTNCVARRPRSLWKLTPTNFVPGEQHGVLETSSSY
jgi:hypothetical protein